MRSTTYLLMVEAGRKTPRKAAMGESGGKTSISNERNASQDFEVHKRKEKSCHSDDGSKSSLCCRWRRSTTR